LQQKFRLFRHMPKWLNRLMDFPPLLRWVSRFAVSTKAEELGDLTLSMLSGQKGYQSSEIADLADWLKNHFKPDVVHFSNLLLSGLAGSIKDATGAKIVGTLQGDDIFLESLPEQFRQQAIQLIRKNSTTFDAITATSTSYADRMSLYLGLERKKISTILPGIAVTESSGCSRGTGKTIGYFARICPEKGFHLLVDAWIEFRKKSTIWGKAQGFRLARAKPVSFFSNSKGQRSTMLILPKTLNMSVVLMVLPKVTFMSRLIFSAFPVRILNQRAFMY